MRAALAGAQAEVVIDFLGYELADAQSAFDLFNGTVRQFIFISSATVYAKPPRQLPLTENAPLGNAWWDYAQKKLACEQWLLQRQRIADFPVTIVRPSHTYSKCGFPTRCPVQATPSPRGWSRAGRSLCHDDGETPWTLTAASDFAVGLAGCWAGRKPSARPSTSPATRCSPGTRLFAEIAAALGATSPRIVKVPTDFICQDRAADDRHPQGRQGPSRGVRQLEDQTVCARFQCRKSFRIGVRESVAWLRAHPEHKHFNAQIDALMDEVIAAWRRG